MQIRSIYFTNSIPSQNKRTAVTVYISDIKLSRPRQSQCISTYTVIAVELPSLQYCSFNGYQDLVMYSITSKEQSKRLEK